MPETVESITVKIRERYGFTLRTSTCYVKRLDRVASAFCLQHESEFVLTVNYKDTELEAAHAALAFLEQQERQSPLLKEAVGIIKRWQGQYAELFSALDADTNAFLARMGEE